MNRNAVISLDCVENHSKELISKTDKLKALEYKMLPKVPALTKLELSVHLTEEPKRNKMVIFSTIININVFDVINLEMNNSYEYSIRNGNLFTSAIFFSTPTLSSQ